MALWQIDFFVLPKSNIEEVKLGFQEYGFDDAPFWENVCMPKLFFDPISSILPIGKSWRKSIIMYGTENSNRMEIFGITDIVESVSLRIDFTIKYESILSQLIEFFILNGLMVLDQELNLVPLNLESFKAVIENAPQVRKYRLLARQEKGGSADLDT